MKKYLLTLILIAVYSFALSQSEGLTFQSSDTALQTAFIRAKEMALHYKGKPADPVGPWYESALPPRSAFCMRDVAHQSLAAEVLGMSRENKNMFTHFVSNISESKDWCSYWEINRLGNPAPEDYRNDTAFWYNLNANFDIMNACWKLYLWTGDETYVKNAAFKNFFNKSVNEYISSWVLEADSLLTRPAHPNASESFNIEDAFHRCRGLPSYSEGVPNIKMGIDLVAAIYRGLLSYAAMLRADGQAEKAELFEQKAKAYQQHIDKDWWDNEASLYNTYYSNNNQFGKTEGETFLLWFDALADSTRKQKTLQHLLANNWNVENLSYFPFIMYQNGYWQKAYNYMLHLTNPATKRREYPEVSYGVIKGFTEGLMGIEADARINRISTYYRNATADTCELNNVPVCGTMINLTHSGKKKSLLSNNGQKTITWRAVFQGSHKLIYINKKPLKATLGKDWLGNTFSFADVMVHPVQQAEAEVKAEFK
ncbi:hypothetical protein FC093_06295 [Ilyomonas limi]|uniref:Alpha-L-rhamnosidase six-hairpin glycosidase domain-containing protein n=1 Tax=Ilyomonas limi TaxID=2575867 RepID=A0A4V6XAX4_9BACT|nr:trehalase family glycosidase [Ilyomonas limi]TKK70353.1 hypothetical protein FC093_06295 [Ilyomonas limi]